MSTSGIVHDDTFCFSGTNYHLWRIRMLCHFRAMGPNIVRIVLVGLHPWKNDLCPSIDENEDRHLGYDAKNSIVQAITYEVFKSIMYLETAHEIWTKLEEIYYGLNLIEGDLHLEESIGNSLDNGILGIIPKMPIFI